MNVAYFSDVVQLGVRDDLLGRVAEEGLPELRVGGDPGVGQRLDRCVERGLRVGDRLGGRVPQPRDDLAF